MDIFSHALAGACTGAAWGRPFTGAALAVLPDIALIGPRKRLPPLFYNVAHSFLFLALVTAIASLFGLGLMAYLCVFSHLLLDAPTHNDNWAPPLLWPIPGRCSIAHEEWEFFNLTWWFGFSLTLLWSLMWITFILLFGIGFQS